MFGLFAHVYDIDDVIAAFCNYGNPTDAEVTYYLNTSNGKIDTTNTGSDSENIFTIVPLPYSFIEDLKTKPRLTKGDDVAVQATEIIKNSNCVGDIYNLFDKQTSGTEWLRERVKASAVRWLDMNGILPPSMSHVVNIQENAPETDKCVNIKVDLL